jgi:hypothetical protein
VPDSGGRTRFPVLAVMVARMGHRPGGRQRGGTQKCDDHACYLNLIAAHQQTAMAAILGKSSQIP